MPIDEQTVLKVARLSRLTLSDSERETIVSQTEDIVKFVEKINALDTSNIEPTYHVIDIKNVRREDVVKESLPVKTISSLAPKSEYDHIVVPQVIE